jgi:hypothetical protein
MSTPDLATPWVPLWPLSPAAWYTGEARNRECSGNENFTDPISWTPIPASADKTALTMTFTKRQPDTKLMLRMNCTIAWVAGATQNLYCGLRVGGVDYQMGQYSTPTGPTLRVVMGGSREISGLAPGTYTIEPIFRSGTLAQLWLYGGDFVSYEVLEMLPSVQPLPVPITPAGYGLALPGEAIDGQEHILVDSLTAPTYQWRFRYNAGRADANKWEFVGGPPLLTEVATNENITSTSYASLATPGPSITIPRAGIYIVSQGCRLVQTSTNGICSMSYDIGATAAVDADYISLSSGSNTGWIHGTRDKRKTIAVAGTVLLSKYKLNGGGPVGIQDRWIRAIPVAVA